MGEATPPGSQNPERDARIVHMRAAGMSYREIGSIVDLSGERVRQLLERIRRQRQERQQ